MDQFSKLANMKTLLIDDDELVRDSIAMAFRNKGCHLLSVRTAEDGLAELKKESFDIFIVDYKLPGMNGMEFLKLASRSHPNTVNLLITSYVNELTDEVFNVGFHDIIQKPFSPKTLINALVKLIEER